MSKQKEKEFSLMAQDGKWSAYNITVVNEEREVTLKRFE